MMTCVVIILTAAVRRWIGHHRIDRPADTPVGNAAPTHSV
jgi:hypothetical protein